ncbi:MAG: DUF4339 domain-containing protein, partial [Bacteroidia bacterium]|nr:DUF4339 domain-containing protein [Bacteroidia bacterium]
MKKYYLHDGIAQQGPFDLEELKGKNITVNTNVWFDPMPGWKPAGTIDELKSIFNPTASSVQDWNNVQFYFSENGVQQGPFTLQQLKGKNISATTPVWYDPLPKWTTAGEVAALKDVISSTATAPQTVAATLNWNNVQFYYTNSAGQQGPFTLEQLRGKNIIANTPVWYDPLPKWTTAGEVAALKDIISSAASAPQAVATTADWNNVPFYYSENGAQQGPFKIDQLKGKNITANTPVWYDPLPKWTTAGEVAALKDIISSAASAPQAVAATTDWNNVQFYFSENGVQQGPFRIDQLKGKNITANTPVWYDPLPKWTTAGEVAALKDIISAVATAPHIVAPTVEDWNYKQFYYSDNTGQKGPFFRDQLRGKNINSGTPVWYAPLAKWTTAGEVDALKDIITST